MADKKISALTAASTPLAGTEVLPIVQSGSTVKVPVSSLTAGRSVTTGPLTIVGGNAGQVLIDNTGQQYIQILIQRNGAANSGGDLLLDGNTGKMSLRNLVAGAWALATGTSAGGTTDRITVAPAGDVTVNTGNLVQGTAAKGVNFTANTPAAGMTSQLLNWYEEGTFTPTIIGTTTTGTGTYSTQTGTYTRIGRMVRFNVAITWSAHTGTGNMEIAGLPFTSNASASSHPISILSSNLTVPSSSIPGGMILASTTNVRLYTLPTSGTDASVSLLALDTAATLWVAGTYIV